jgi:predicted O-methyltransferase YrrM
MRIPGIINKILWSEKWLEIVIPLKFAAFKLKSAASKCESLESYVDLASNSLTTFPFLGANIKPLQVKDEIVKLLKILAKLKPMYILEIGTARGGTLFLSTRVAASDATLISVDLPGGPFGGGYPEIKVSYYKSFAIQNQKIRLIRGNSHSPSTLNMIEKILDGHDLDFLFIDGDHSYNGVKTDFEMYGKLVRKGGIIAFHDIVQGPPENVGGVPKFWDEIKHNFQKIELVKNWRQGEYGIDVIYV